MTEKQRKPLPENCNGSIDCPVDEHVGRRNTSTKGHFTISHIKLTLGQHKTLRERRTRARGEQLASRLDSVRGSQQLPH